MSVPITLQLIALSDATFISGGATASDTTWFCEFNVFNQTYYERKYNLTFKNKTCSL